jgi:hypothetical protein
MGVRIINLKYLAVCVAIAVGTLAIVDTSVAACIVDSKHNLQANSGNVGSQLCLAWP